MKWKQLFERHILDRGYDYYCDGAVEDLKVYKDVIHATVCGTEDYDVEITMRGDKITDLYCSCPYAESGETCKHMAAVLYEWSDIGEGKGTEEDDAGNVQYYKELKDLYSFQEWERVREELFAKLPIHAHIDRLYKEEKMYERLLEYVLTTEGLYALWEYETVLQDKYPSELLQKYVEEVNQMATCTSDRKRYREWVAILRRMIQLEGGEEKVEQIVKHWREIYKNRPALMDELSKI